MRPHLLFGILVACAVLGGTFVYDRIRADEVAQTIAPVPPASGEVVWQVGRDPLNPPSGASVLPVVPNQPLAATKPLPRAQTEEGAR